MNPDLTAVLISAGIAGWLGFRAGRWASEAGRARYDMTKTWTGRSRYRDDS